MFPTIIDYLDKENNLNYLGGIPVSPSAPRKTIEIQIDLRVKRLYSEFTPMSQQDEAIDFIYTLLNEEKKEINETLIKAIHPLVEGIKKQLALLKRDSSDKKLKSIGFIQRFIRLHADPSQPITPLIDGISMVFRSERPTIFGTKRPLPNSNDSQYSVLKSLKIK